MNLTIPPDVMNKFWEHISSSPHLLGLLFSSWLSGHFWLFIMFNFVGKKKNEKAMIDNFMGKIAIGVSWFLLIVYSIHIITAQKFYIEYTQVIDLILTSIIVGFILQFLIYTACTLFVGGE